MDRGQVARILRVHADALRSHGVRGLDLFGSSARQDGEPGSDVDVVIDVPDDRKFSLLDLASVRVLLCDVTGREVDVVIDQDLAPAFRRAIEPDRYRVF